MTRLRMTQLRMTVGNDTVENDMVGNDTVENDMLSMIAVRISHYGQPPELNKSEKSKFSVLT